MAHTLSVAASFFCRINSRPKIFVHLMSGYRSLRQLVMPGFLGCIFIFIMQTRLLFKLLHMSLLVALRLVRQRKHKFRILVLNASYHYLAPVELYDRTHDIKSQSNARLVKSSYRSYKICRTPEEARPQTDPHRCF